MSIKNLPLLLLLLVSFIASAQNKKATPPGKVPNTGYVPFPSSPKLKDDTARIKYLNPKTDSIPYAPVNYYIAAVIDSTYSFDSVGFSLQPKSGKQQRLSLKDGTVGYFTNYINKKIKKDTSLYPVVLIVRNVDIRDERYKSLGDETTVKYAFEFASVYKNDTIIINSFSGENWFRTRLGDKKNYDSMFSIPIDKWAKLDDHVKELADKHPTFCKGVKVNVAIRTLPATSDSLFYDSHYQLTWDDYRGEAEVPDRILSYFVIDYDGDTKYENGFIVLDLSLAAAFIKSDSWVHGNLQKNEVLQHENYKFKLAYIHMQRLKKQLEGLNLTKDNYSTEVSALYKKTMKESTAEFVTYDKETNIGLRKKEQQRWQQTIDAAIAELN